MKSQIGWTSLFVVVIMAACGPTEVSDINGGSGVSDDDDAGDDDDDIASIPTQSAPPSGAPILTNVPSFATWNSTIRPMLCPACHTGASGGLTFGSQTDAASLKYFWFESICDQNDVVAPTAGIQTYSPPTGRIREFLSGNDAGHGQGDPAGGIIGPGNGATVDSWLNQGAASTPPDCNTYFDLASSS